MDKKRLNNEIILCRPAVRKAKVAIIRKLIKKMKILKACKIEAMKEKKLKKSERLFKKVQIMKRINVDDVTKFALRNNDIEAFLKQPKVNLKQNTLAHLARHEAVVKKINFIKEQIPNWERELPILLDSLGKKKKKTVSKQETVKNVGKPVVTKESGGQLAKNVTSKAKQGVKEPSSQPPKTISVGKTNVEEKTELEPITKIEDPFFIGKKMVAPKLVLESLSDKTDSDKIEKFKSHSVGRRVLDSSVFDKKPFKAKRISHDFKSQKPVPVDEPEKLHPSWAAKKVKLIKPFQGKKITFSND